MNINVVVYISITLHRFICWIAPNTMIFFFALIVDFQRNKGFSVWIEVIVSKYIEMYTTTLISIISFYLMGIGITARVENKWEYLLCSSYELYKLRLASPFSTRMPLWTPSLLGETSNSKANQKRSVHIGNTGSVKHAWTSSKNGQNFAVVIIKKLYLTKTSGFDW